MSESEGEKRGTLANFFAFLWRHKFLIVGLVGGSTLATIIYVLVVPVQYTAKATLLPPESDSSGLLSTAMQFLGSGSNLGGLNLGGAGSEAVIQESIIRSRRLADLMNEDFNLDERYRTSKREARLRVWKNRLKTSTNRQGLMTVGYQDRDPEFASRIVTRLLEHLDRFNRENRSTSSRKVRLFLEEATADSEDKLNAMEDSLAAYQAKNRTLALSSTAEGVVEAGAEILIQRLRLVTESEMLRQNLGADAPALLAKESEIKALDRELARLPQLNSEMGKLMRLRRVYARTHSYLAAQLEETRIEEARDTRTIEILDPPIVPQEKSWPQRTWTVLAVFFVSGILSLLLAKGLDSVREMRNKLGAGNV